MNGEEIKPELSSKDLIEHATIALEEIQLTIEKVRKDGLKDSGTEKATQVSKSEIIRKSIMNEEEVKPEPSSKDLIEHASIAIEEILRAMEKARKDGLSDSSTEKATMASISEIIRKTIINGEEIKLAPSSKDIHSSPSPPRKVRGPNNLIQCLQNGTIKDLKY